MLFTDRTRTDLGPPGHTESEFEYLDRSARPEAERVRQVLDEWLSRYPPQEQDACQAQRS